MKKWFTIGLVLALQFQYASQLIVLVSFVVNQQVIAKIWCEKKAIEDNTCNGKCYLKKQLKKAEANNTSESNKLPQYKFKFDFEYALLCKQGISFNLLNVKYLPFELHFKTGKGFIDSMIKPPTC